MSGLELFTLAFLMLTTTIKATEYLTHSEAEIVFLMANHFRSSSCILGLSYPSRKYWPQHDFSHTDNCLLSMLTYKQMKEYMMTAKKEFRKPIIAIKAEEDSFSILRQLSGNISLSAAVWIMVSEKPLKKDNFRGIYIPFDCEFIYVNPREQTYFLTEVYRISRSSPIELFNFGAWTKSEGLVIHEEYMYRRRFNFKNNEFNVWTKHIPPFVGRQTGIRGGSRYSGFMYELWKEVEHSLQFKSQVGEKPNTDEGIGHMFDSEEVHFGVLPVIYHHSTLDEMDITFPIYVSKPQQMRNSRVLRLIDILCKWPVIKLSELSQVLKWRILNKNIQLLSLSVFLFAHRPGRELEWDSYLKPFDGQTWWTILAWMACSSVSLAIMYKIAWSCGASEKESDCFTFTFSKSFATAFRAVCMQGSDVAPKSNSCRLLFLSIYLTALVLNAAFSAALFSLLTIPTSRDPFYRFEEVLQGDTFRLGLVRDSALYKILKDYESKNPDSILSKLLHKAEGVDGFPSDHLHGLTEICYNKKFVMLSELSSVLYFKRNLTLDCQEKIISAGPNVFKNFIGFGLKKGSPYKEILNLCLLKMLHEGIMRRLFLNNWPTKIPMIDTSWMRITLADISPVLYMYLTGAAMATISLATECLLFFTIRRGTMMRIKIRHRNTVQNNANDNYHLNVHPKMWTSSMTGKNKLKEK